MHCIKCGGELKKQQVFCDACQEDMLRYPIKPGMPIQLPVRTAVQAAKKKPTRAKKALSPEERVLRMRSTIRLLALALAAAVLAFAVTAVLALHLLDQRDGADPIGQNYSTVSQDE